MGRPGSRALDVPIGPVRAHIAALMTTGASPRQIAELAGVNTSSIRNWLRQHPTKRLPVLTLIRADMATKVLGVSIADADAASQFIDAAATIRRLHALAVVGWTPGRIERLLGVRNHGFTTVSAGREFRIRKEFARALREAYDTLAFSPPTFPNRESRQESRRAQANARALGWPGPLDWEDIELGVLDEWDDFDVDESYVDDVAIESAMSGGRVHLTPVERDEAVTRMRAKGIGGGAIADRLGLSGETYASILARLSGESDATAREAA